MTGRHLLRVVAAVALTAAAGLGLPPAPASAAACSTARGVTVVVDFHELGGGVQQVCDAGGAGEVAATQFEESGFTLTRVASQQGFVCRVQGKPASDPCQRTPPSDAYWGLWWSNGTSGTWTYASQGVDSLKVPEGGYVAFSWNGSSTTSPPGARPTAHQSQPSPSPSPSPSSSSPQPQPSSGPSGDGSHSPPSSGTPGATGGAVSAAASAPGESGATQGASPGRRTRSRPAPSASSSASASPSADPTASFSTSPGVGPDAGAAAAPDPADPSGDGLPRWVAPAAIGLLFAAAAATAVVRRRRGTPGP